LTATTAPPKDNPPPFAAVRSTAYPWYVLLVLMTIYAVQYIDRQVITVLLEPIRKEFQLSDRQLGLLTSASFAVAYAITCVPLGMLADRVSRTRLLSAILAIWSGFTALSGIAQSFAQLLLARVIVGAAEAGNNPTGMSLLSDYFGPKNRSTAMGLYFFGQALGVLGGFVLGGVIAAHYGWRAAFFAAGLPGLALVVLVLATVREPRRGGLDPIVHRPVADVATPSLGGVLKWLGQQRSARLLIVGNVVNCFLVAGLLVWMASFLMRSHGMGMRTVGLALGFGIGIGAATGSLLGGLLSDWVGRAGVKRRVMLLALTVLVTLPFFAFGLVVEDGVLSVVLVSAGAAINASQYGPTFSLLQDLVKPTMRGTATSITFFLNNLLGYGAGPLVVGILSDALAASSGADSLRHALFIMLIGQLVAAVLFWRSRTTLEADLSRVQQSAD